ncbi:restriction endonuclease [Streptomyces sp. SRF1]|uniref:nSTAND3 domain-containing NTPase n=1 Tax=Streptomyces sp. SRF1 TaxID=1549642 RepID=UPI0025AF3392|nr:restriction endonuclease [Streptomyces sp. SRF1]MDN3053231.1 restriction endonuclease [Streptomyces sp. SRF1]
MESFDLSRLTDFDFEAVCKDLLEEELGMGLEIFSAGADGGVDLRHLSSTGESLVVQCKHWHRSGRAKLIEHIENVEAAKVAKLKPQRYILATSVSLTRGAKDKLFEALKPYAKTPGDIYGKEEIDALLRTHDHIVRRHLRLWLTSASVLNALLTKNVVTRSHALAREFDDTLRTYAANPSYGRALELLESRHVCVIAGIPGIGKTTLSQVLSAHYMALGYELVEISEDSEEANHLWNDELSQIYYYDDFLGQTTFDEKLGKNEDSRLLSLMKRISSSPNKRFILTTREYILAQAKRRYERLDRHSFDMHTCVVDLADYTYQARASILYNHVYGSSLPQPVKQSFAEARVYRPIIEHRNFNPRIIAVTLAGPGLLSGDQRSLSADIIANLEDPQRIWDHIVRNQLGETDVKLLKLILSFMSDIHLGDLQELWMECGESLRDLRSALAVLDGTMLKSVQQYDAAHIGFHNPSVRDYMVNYVQSDMGEVISLISLVKRFEQLEALWLVFPAPGGGPMAETYKKRREQLEQVVSTVFHAEPVNLGFHKRGKDYVRRAWLCLEMGIDIDSEIIREIALEAASDEDTVVNAYDSTDLHALFQTLARCETPRGEEIRSDCISWAVEWVMGDLSDWNLINEAQDFLGSAAHHHHGIEVSEALEMLDSVRDDYAEAAFEDWAQTHRDPSIPGAEMKEIIEHYKANGSTAPFDMDEYDTVLQRLDEFDAAHESAFSAPRNEGARLAWSAARKVESMMKTLRESSG